MRIIVLILISILVQGTTAFAGRISSGGDGTHVTVILNCEATSQDGTIYQLLVGPPNSIELEDASSPYPVRMYKYSKDECHSLAGFDQAKVKLSIAGEFHMSFWSLKEDVIPEFNASGWDISVPVEKRINSGIYKNKFLSDLIFHLTHGSGNQEMHFYCDNSISETKNLIRSCVE